MNTIVIHSSIQTEAVLGEVFREILSKDLLMVFKDIPYVPRFEPFTSFERFPRPGSERMIFFEDFSSARQIFLTFIPEMSFSFSIDNFTMTRLYGLSKIECQFAFFKLNSGSTKVSVEYRFKCRSRIWKFFFMILIEKYMQERISIFLKKCIL